MSYKAKLMIAAQPTRGIDVGSIEFIHNQIVAKRDEGVAVLLVSSELDEIMALSDRIAVMYVGKIVEMAETRTLLRKPNHPYTEALIAAAPLPDPDFLYDRNRMITGEIPSPLAPPTG